ncbi:MAG: alpha-mannosidase, partial [Ramlibacter sp.]|nr:alpha-mannosidase [Cryobacterium sp.]
MHDDSTLVEFRISRFVRERLNPAVNRATVPLSIDAWDAPGEPVPFSEAVRQAFTPFGTGRAWGRPWGTTWFHVTGTVPAPWTAQSGTRLELVVDLGFSQATPGFQAEGLVWTPDGVILKAVEPRNRSVPL